VSVGIVWFRRDLRVADHPALRAALDAHDRIVPFFCLDDRVLAGRHASGPRTQFLLESLTELDAALGRRGSGLIVRRGAPERELGKLACELGCADVHVSADLTPYDRLRSSRLGPELELHAHPGLTVIDDVRALRTQAGRPYTTFSPFHRTWLDQTRRGVLQPPLRLPPVPDIDPGAIPRLDELDLSQEVSDPRPGGEPAGRAALSRFLGGPVRDYADARDDLGRDATSRLSPYLHLGCVSPREIEARLPRGAGAEAFRRQLCWRDFYLHVLGEFPANARSEFQARYRGGALGWSRATRPLEAWQEGRTGFPLVDAGMRQLRREGWMHNRARLVAGSFLTKDLGIDWRLGERWFMRLLLDGDEANNNGNWQWIASVGVDPQPAFRRIYNPARHQERFDPHNSYVRRYVPELREVPDRYMREPWTMPLEIQQAARCVIGRDYPEPIVDRRRAREEALERFRAA
jgi:deoxyribodipyrimidine photo-lyase